MEVWLSQNWLAVLTFVVAATAAWAAIRQLQLFKRDVSIAANWSECGPGVRQEIKFEQAGQKAEPVKLALEVLNVGGTRSKKGRLTVTLSDLWQVVNAPDWTEDIPNAEMRGDCQAIATELPRLRRNEKKQLPPFWAQPRDPELEGASRTFIGTARWEAWINDRGANSDDLKFKLMLRRP